MFYEDVLRALLKARVRFVLVGGVAVILHGVPRTTADLDLVAAPDRANLLRLVRVMRRLGFRPRAPVRAEDLADARKRSAWIRGKRMKAFTFWRDGRPLDEVDILLVSPVPYNELRLRAHVRHAGGLDLPVADPRDLIRMKRRTGRAQDASDIDALRRLEGIGDA